MKKLLILLLLLNGTTFSAALTCPRIDKMNAQIMENKGTWCNEGKFSEKGASTLAETETNDYQKEILSPLLKDNIHDMKWIVEKSTQDLREHVFCFESICASLQSTCNDNKFHSNVGDQRNWCKSRLSGFNKAEQEKTRQVIIENQQRKSRSNLREKMRAIEVRTSNLFIPLLQKFIDEYEWFTTKTSTFVRNPL